MKLEKVLVIGGGGFVGSCLINRLAGRGIQVVVPTRRRESRKSLALLPQVELLAANVQNPLDLEELMDGVDAVINLAGILHDSDSQQPYGRRFAAVHVELPEKIVAAMRKTGVRRLLHMSALPAASNAPSAYFRSKAAGEAAVLVAANKLDVTVFRPSIIFGPGDAFLNIFAALLRVSPVLFLPGAEARMQPVYVGDVADACITALDNRATYGKTYDLAGPEIYTLKQLVEYAGELTGHPRLILNLPDSLARLMASLLGCLPNPPMSPDNLRSMQVDSIVDGQSNPPNWQPQPLEAIAPTYLAPSKSTARLNELRSRVVR